MLSMKPRKEAIGGNGKRFKVDERITTLSYEAHMKYTNKDWFIGAKSVLGSNLTQASGLGGIRYRNPIVNVQGEQKYTPIACFQLGVQPCLWKEVETGNFRRIRQELGNKRRIICSEWKGTTLRNRYKSRPIGNGGCRTDL